MTSTVHTGPLQTILCPLPRELFYIIVNYLDTEEIGILPRTSVQLRQSLQAVLYRRAEDKLPNNGGRLLDWAAQHGRLDTNKKFLKFARPKAPLDGLVHSALEKAASAGHEEVVHFPLRVEVNPTLHLRQMDFTKRNSSALIYATAARYTRIVQVLLEAKTDVYIPRMLAGSAEMLASASGYSRRCRRPYSHRLNSLDAANAAGVQCAGHREKKVYVAPLCGQ
ncbi:hypothetical protein BDV24DRAFT_166045 [Aspergillus arachidicola]|uniref:F-box domain-containing protein n=1 Tax=Aspergillus arachidicola TaxID=656916 RepID=A0A5N6XZW1_9EURO|nr:hypothetical protein BDV24DRAFT_166045 [Aspergillus arachidicola]